METAGDDSSPGQVPGLYEELRELASRHFARQPESHTLQPTALVHEAFLKLGEGHEVGSVNHTHFLSLASRVMRQILVDHARAKNTLRRGGSAARRVELAEAEADSENFTPIEPQDTLAIEEALLELAQLSPEKARLIELRFFGGLTEVEAAKVMGISRSSIKRQWRLVRAWLSSRLGSGEDG